LHFVEVRIILLYEFYTSDSCKGRPGGQAPEIVLSLSASSDKCGFSYRVTYCCHRVSSSLDFLPCTIRILYIRQNASVSADPYRSSAIGPRGGLPSPDPLPLQELLTTPCPQLRPPRAARNCLQFAFRNSLKCHHYICPFIGNGTGNVFVFRRKWEWK